MYLTLYKQTNSNTPIPTYTNLMRTSFTPQPTAYYKTTLYIACPEQRENLTEKNQQHLLNVEQALKQAWELLKEYEHSHEQQYFEFKIPKRSGGLRTINAPNDNFKLALSCVKEIFEQKIKCLPHDAAYAYIKQRSTLDALKKHQLNESNWYLKIDLTDFFPNCTPELIFEQLKKLYPFYYISPEYDEILKKIIKVCCLNNGLPQGTPMSPLLTNLIMVPYDRIIYTFTKRGSGNHYVYTRYADDILISSKAHFDWKAIEQYLEQVLTPFCIKKHKTRYGSKAGSNWNLGLMLNKDNQITLGSVRKKELNAMVNNFIKDFKENRPWSKEDTQYLQGHLSYLNQIEPAYYTHILQKYETKHNVQLKPIIKMILN